MSIAPLATDARPAKKARLEVCSVVQNPALTLAEADRSLTPVSPRQRSHTDPQTCPARRPSKSLSGERPMSPLHFQPAVKPVWSGDECAGEQQDDSVPSTECARRELFYADDEACDSSWQQNEANSGDSHHAATKTDDEESHEHQTQQMAEFFRHLDNRPLKITQ